jgi:hypothetical protein
MQKTVQHAFLNASLRRCFSSLENSAFVPVGARHASPLHEHPIHLERPQHQILTTRMQSTKPWRGKGDHKDRPYENGAGANPVLALHENHLGRSRNRVSSLEVHA